jgi:uncharacterized Zn-binding protein involved in type VI secretion
VPPAARVMDMHVCPMATPGTPPIPHVGGPILPPCSPNVFTGFLPQARITDQALCVGPPDIIILGSPTVMVNFLLAARVTDMTAHGGEIVVGCPTVIIGESGGGGAAPGAMAMTFVINGATIEVDGDAAFITAATQALSKILATRSGEEWLRQMAKNKQKVKIVKTSDDNGYCQADDATKAGNGVGSGSTVSWNPNKKALDPALPGKQGTPGAPVILAHEMVHALHNGNGDERDGPNDTFPGQSGSSARNEERSTVGTSGPVQQPDGTTEANAKDYSKDVPTENSFRDDLGVPARPSYYPSTWPGGAPW